MSTHREATPPPTSRTVDGAMLQAFEEARRLNDVRIQELNESHSELRVIDIGHLARVRAWLSAHGFGGESG
jgi:hypothetical protein